MISDKISLIVPVFNKAQYSRRCFEAVVQTSHRPFEIVVIDNGSTDETPDLLKDFARAADAAGIELKIVRNDENLGASTARNQGLDAATGKYIAVMDNDIVIRQRSWANKLAQVLADRPEVGIVGPKLQFAFPPYLVQCAGASVSPTGRVFFDGRGLPPDAPEVAGEREVQACISACWMMPRTVVDEVGDFDEIYNPVQFEDIDFSYKVRQAGYKILYVPHVQMYHFENVTTGMSPTINGNYLIIKNGMTFKKRWHFMFSKENGPDDKTFHWAKIKKVPLDEIGELEMVD